jgi:hypothetical protein
MIFLSLFVFLNCLEDLVEVFDVLIDDP